MRVNDSQAYRKMDVARERISRILELREILMSFQTGFNLVNAAAVCAILESISGLEPSSVITEHQVLEACDCLKLLSIYCPCVWFVIALLCLILKVDFFLLFFLSQ